MIITIVHCRKCGYCISGVKDYCITHNIDFKLFIKNGINSDELPKDDIIINNIINKAKDEQNKHNSKTEDK